MPPPTKPLATDPQSTTEAPPGPVARGIPANGADDALARMGMTLLITPATPPTIGQHLAYVERLVSKGGPAPGDYGAFNSWLAHVAEEVRTGRMSEGELRAIRDAFGHALSLETNQGLGLRKPHGYPGDYEILDRIYREHVTDDPLLRNWDLYFHAQAAPRAVRNRKDYFIRLLDALAGSHEGPDPIPVLNVASGPARDVVGFFESSSHGGRVTIECVDSDPDAIVCGRRICGNYLDRVTFRQINALRYTSVRKFRLIWSSGLFDYFGDEGFEFLLDRLLAMLTDDGELVVGNFSKSNPTRDYMEVMGDWSLYYRDARELRARARACGVAPEDIRIGQESSGVNLFLHIKRGTRSGPL